MKHPLSEARIISFGLLFEGQKFATVAKNQITVWTKIHDEGLIFKAGQIDDGFTCPMPNAISDCGFAACFNNDKMVCQVNADRWSKDKKEEIGPPKRNYKR